MPDWSEDETIMLSAIEHYSYCPRQCALIHVEKVFDENVFTTRGSFAHARADEPTERTEGGVTVERALPIWSEEYGVYGRADVVELHPDGSVVPVEYKIGDKKRSGHADMQLCAQAMCLEEMFGRAVGQGAVYSTTSHQRRDVEFTADLRQRTVGMIDQIRQTLAAGVLPAPVNDARCPNCSLVHICLPSCGDVIEEDAGIACLFKPSEGEVID